MNHQQTTSLLHGAGFSFRFRCMLIFYIPAGGLALFPGPAQLFVACSTEKRWKLGWNEATGGPFQSIIYSALTRLVITNTSVSHSTRHIVVYIIKCTALMLWSTPKCSPSMNGVLNFRNISETVQVYAALFFIVKPLIS